MSRNGRNEGLRGDLNGEVRRESKRPSGDGLGKGSEMSSAEIAEFQTVTSGGF
jgi:hypothetical protein